MPEFNFNTISVSSVLNQLLNTVPLSVTSYNFLIVGNTLIIPLGDNPKNTYTAKTKKKDIKVSETSLTAVQVQDGSTVITQRTGDQIRVSSIIAISLFQKLFNFTNQDILTVPVAGVIDFLLGFAYENFLTTDCILIDPTGVHGLGTKRLKMLDWNRTLDPKDPDRLILDMQFSFEAPVEKEDDKSSPYEVSEDDVNAALGN